VGIVQCKPEKTDQVIAAFEEVIPPSREVDGVVSFDIGRDLGDANSFIATEVFVDRAALDRQESLSVVQTTMGLLQDSLVAEPEATIFQISSSEPYGD
jgi:quinol monooxygenase YgiN